jgi:hypothetical protein
MVCSYVDNYKILQNKLYLDSDDESDTLFKTKTGLGPYFYPTLVLVYI